MHPFSARGPPGVDPGDLAHLLSRSFGCCGDWQRAVCPWWLAWWCQGGRNLQFQKPSKICPEERDPMVEGEEAGPQLQQWEQKKGRGGPSPAPKSMASPSNGSSPTPTPNAGAGVSASANGSSASANGSSPGPTPNAGAASSNGGPGRSLLGAFGNVSM